jgi:hypothetical protein
MRSLYRSINGNIIMKYIVIALALLAPTAAFAEDVKVIRLHLGGNISRHMKKMDRLKESDTRVEIRGSCTSACTMYTGLDNMCAALGVWFNFHGPVIGPFPAGGASYRNGVRVMAHYMHPDIAKWYLDKYLHNKLGSYQFSTLTSDELIEAGTLQECGTRSAQK